MRKTKNITLIEDGEELKFLVKQMSAMQLIRWTMKLTGLIGKAGLGVPQAKDNDPAALTDALNAHGVKDVLAGLGRLEPDDVQPLIDGLLACCHHINGPNSLTQLTPDLLDGIINDPRTLTALLRESALLNLGFWLPVRDMADLRANLSGSPAGETLHVNLRADQGGNASSSGM